MRKIQEFQFPDIESGSILYPGMMENPQMRWTFIRKVYIIIAVQLLLTSAVCVVMIELHQVANFITTTMLGLVIYIVSLISAIIAIILLIFVHKRHPLNFFLLAVLTAGISFSVGLTCAFKSGKVIFEAVVLTAAVVVSLTLYTFWAARRGHDFNFLGPFLFASLLVILIFGLVQVFFPLGKITTMIFSGVAAILFSAYIVYDTDNLIKRLNYDEYILGAVSLYTDIMNLFLVLLQIFGAIDD